MTDEGTDRMREAKGMGVRIPPGVPFSLIEFKCLCEFRDHSGSPDPEGSGIWSGIDPEINRLGLRGSVSSGRGTSMLARWRNLQGAFLRVAARLIKIACADLKRFPTWPNSAPIHGRMRLAPETTRDGKILTF